MAENKGGGGLGGGTQTQKTRGGGGGSLFHDMDSREDPQEVFLHHPSPMRDFCISYQSHVVSP